MNIIILILICITWFFSLLGWFLENRQRKITLLYLSEKFDELAKEQVKKEQKEESYSEKRYLTGANIAFKLAKRYVDVELEN